MWRETTADGVYATYLKTWTDAGWIELGGSASGAGITGERTSEHASLAVGRDGEPIVAFDHAGDIYVVHWDGAAWTELAGQLEVGGVSASGLAAWPTLAVDPAGAMFLAWVHDQQQIFVEAFVVADET
jgi:hypothetical protein